MYKSIMNNLILTIIAFVIVPIGLFAEAKNEQDGSKVKNIILLIGDGMGVSYVQAAYTANGGSLNMARCLDIGFTTTHSADRYITDSGAAGTAIATGVKTNNGYVGLDPSRKPVKSILKYAGENGLSTGLVATSTITHATPAAFYANQRSRSFEENIALDLINTEVDFFAGGGKSFFVERKDKVNLVNNLIEKNYQVVVDVAGLENPTGEKVAGLLASGHLPKISEGRGDMLPKATEAALNFLSNNSKGFFIMIEGSQIDWGGHANDIQYIIDEMLDFDQAVGVALDFAEKNGETLVIVASDHETGGLGINNGNIRRKNVVPGYTTTDHTGVMVPVFAYGPRSELFRGIFDNTDLFHKMMEVYGFVETK